MTSAQPLVVVHGITTEVHALVAEAVDDLLAFAESLSARTHD